MTADGAISGTRTDTVGPDMGIFSGRHIGLSLPAGTPGTVYRGVSRGTDGSMTIFVFAVDGTTVSGNGIALEDNSTYTLSGTLSGSSLVVVANNGSEMTDATGTLNPNGTIDGTYMNRFPDTGTGSFNSCADFLVGM